MAEPPDQLDPAPGQPDAAPGQPDSAGGGPGDGGEPRPAEDLYYGIAPPDPERVLRSWALTPVRAEVVYEDESVRPERARRGPLQYTLADLLILTTGVAVMLSVVVTFTWHWSIAAGLSGIGAFAATLVLVQFEPENRAVRVACWTMLGFYVLACMAAIVTRR